MFNFNFFKVHLLAFRNGDIRLVAVPGEELLGKSLERALDTIYYRGQNDFALVKQMLPSVSMGDVIEYEGALFRVAAFGFKAMSAAEFEAYKQVPQRDRAFGIDDLPTKKSFYDGAYFKD